MKTRKYKDQKQRTNFVQYESQNILIQYCKKIKVSSTSLLSSPELDIQALSKTPPLEGTKAPFGTQHYKNKGPLQYP
eukprot:COSAG06_NODE_58359_length_277_cov_0.735955_1_plen_76_part_01